MHVQDDFIELYICYRFYKFVFTGKMVG